MKRGGFGKNGAWTWQLPPKVAKTALDGHTNYVAALDDVSHLSKPEAEKTESHAPPKTAKKPIDRHTNCVAAFDPVGGLCEKKFEPDYEEF